jgi:transposase-like protein
MKSNETPDAGKSALTGKQARVLAALVSGETIEAAAKGNATNPSTVHAWLNRADFQGAYRDALSDIVGHTSAQLKAACGVAVETLREVATDGTAPASARVSASRAIIELTARTVELDELAARIEALEGLAL